MTKHTCKHCNRIFEYCRGCLLSPIPHKDAGYCSKECYEASKIKAVPVIEPEIIEEVVLVEESTDEIIEAEVITPVETATVVEPTIQKETYNAYKKKKKKHR